MPKILLIATGLSLPCASAFAVGAQPTLGLWDLLQVTISLIMVLAAIVGVTWLLRRFTRLGGAMGGALQVLGGLSLGARERIVLVQVGEQQLLLGVAPGRIQMLHVLEKPLSVPPPPADFSSALRAMIQKEP